MPIYEYRCSDCGFKEEYLQKVSEPTMTVCPTCGKPSFVKLLSAAGFQLKGSGWYATDFRNSSKGKGKTEGNEKSEQGKSGAKSEPAVESKSESKSDKTESKSEKAEASSASAQGAGPASA